MTPPTSSGNTLPRSDSPTRRLLVYFSRHKGRLAASIIATFIIGNCDTLVLLVLGRLIDFFSRIESSLRQTGSLAVDFEQSLKGIHLYSVSVHTVGQAMTWMLIAGGLVVAIILVKVLFVYAKEYLVSSVAQKVLMTIRNDLFRKLLRLPIAFYDKRQTGEVLARVTNDVTNLDQSINASVWVFQSIIMSFVFLVAMIVINWKFTLFILLIFPISGGVIRVFGKRIRFYSRKVAENIADISAILSEKLSAIRIVKAFSREDVEVGRFEKLTRQTYSHAMKSVRQVAIMKPVNEIVSILGTVVVMVFCGYLLVGRSMSIGDLTVLVGLITSAYKPMKTLGDANNTLQRALASAQRIFEFLDEEIEGAGEPPGKLMMISRGEIVFRDVTFAYQPDFPVLRDIALAIQPGETVALVGPSGAGKSTMMQLIPRFYDVTDGAILIDGEDIRHIQRNSLRQQMALVPQEVILFSGTVESNIRYGRWEATPDEVKEAAKQANAHDFIMELEFGYDAQIGERGIQLSGGQRQRIAIARAILADPKILLLDEATSSLDTESEVQVQQALEKLMRGRTSIAIAHRLSTVMNADRIVVLDHGRIVQQGSHEKLLKDGGLYRRLYDLQFRDSAESVETIAP
jgi:subfamily B ATP-binding cassette protein MsbA